LAVRKSTLLSWNGVSSGCLLRISAPYGLAYVALNLTRPPFDDVHVRRALAFALDRSALRDAWGGPNAGSIPQHVIPDELLGSELRDYTPFETAGNHGDLARAKAELARSRYRTRNGMCIAEACKRVSLSPVYECTCYAAGQRMSPLIRDRAAQLGIRLQIHTRSFDKIFRPSENIPSTPNGEWFVDYPDPSSFLTRHLRGAGIPDVDNWNISLVGITPAQARRQPRSKRPLPTPVLRTTPQTCAASMS
jgi:ABC-type transport system substrate-binding protein